MAFTIDRVIRMTAEVVGNHTLPDGSTYTEGDLLFTVKDVQDASLSTSAELEDAVDGQGNIINQYLRSKTAEWSGNNALFDFGMAATQYGAKVNTGSHTITKTEIITVNASANSATLGGSLKANSTNYKVYSIDKDGMTLGERVSAATISGNAVSGFTSANEAKKYFVKYEAVTEATAKKIENRADAAAIPFKLTVEALGNDTCSGSTSYLYITAPYAKMSPDFDWSVATDGTHDFTINCMKQYCNDEGLFTVIKA